MKKDGLQVQFEENQSGDCSNTTISITTGSVAPSTYFHKRLEPISKVYHISCPKQLKTRATIRIKHDAPDDVLNLCFVTCDDNQPDDFKIILGGTFTPNYGELVVSKNLSWYSIGRRFSRFDVRRVVYWLEKQYVSSLHCSSTSRLMPSGQQQYCNIYLSVVKDSRLFTKSVENYINQEFQEEVKLASRYAVYLNDTDEDVTVQYIYVQNSATNFYLDEPDCTHLDKSAIRSYVDACPPFLKFRLTFSPDSSVEVKFILDGFKNIVTHTVHSSDLPGIIIYSDLQIVEYNQTYYAVCTLFFSLQLITVSHSL